MKVICVPRPAAMGPVRWASYSAQAEALKVAFVARESLWMS